MKTLSQISLIGSILCLMVLAYRLSKGYRIDIEEYAEYILFITTSISTILYISKSGGIVKLDTKLNQSIIENKILKAQIENKELTKILDNDNNSQIK